MISPRFLLGLAFAVALVEAPMGVIWVPDAGPTNPPQCAITAGVCDPGVDARSPGGFARSALVAPGARRPRVGALGRRNEEPPVSSHSC